MLDTRVLDTHRFDWKAWLIAILLMISFACWVGLLAHFTDVYFPN